jgi:two-component system sensor histidine kinase GlrK
MKQLPRLLVQLLAGNLITMLPLLAGIAFTVVTLQEASVHQQQLLDEGVAATRFSAAISDQLKQLERAVRQRRVLGEEGFEGVVDIAHRQTLTLLLYAEQELPESLGAREEPVATLQKRLSDIPRLLLVRTPDEDVANFFATNAALGEQLRDGIQSWLDERLSANQAERVATQRLLIVLGILTLPLTVLVGATVTLLVARPLRTLSRSILRLGLGDWDDPIPAIAGARDIAELGARLEWLRSRLIHLEREQQTFVRNMTHELKTPLAAITEAASLLAEEIPGALNVRQHDVLQLLRKNSRALQELIEQLLRFNSAVDGSTTEEAPYALRDLLETAFAQVADLARAKGLRAEFEGDNHCCRVDRRRLLLMLGNLLSNAVRHSPPRGRLSLCWHATSGALVLSVTDDGEGVPAEEAERIFLPFHSRTKQDAGGHRGSGLGLAIVRECATQLGGEVRVENVAGRGARFEVRLPLARPAGEENV